MYYVLNVRKDTKEVMLYNEETQNFKRMTYSDLHLAIMTSGMCVAGASIINYTVRKSDDVSDIRYTTQNHAVDDFYVIDKRTIMTLELSTPEIKERNNINGVFLLLDRITISEKPEEGYSCSMVCWLTICNITYYNSLLEIARDIFKAKFLAEPLAVAQKTIADTGTLRIRVKIPYNATLPKVPIIVSSRLIITARDSDVITTKSKESYINIRGLNKNTYRKVPLSTIAPLHSIGSVFDIPMEIINNKPTLTVGKFIYKLAIIRGYFL